MKIRAARQVMGAARRRASAIEWMGVLADAWGRRPVCLRASDIEAAGGGPLFHEDDLLAGLIESRNGLARGEACEVVLYDRDRVACSGAIASDRSVSPLLRHLPVGTDRSLDAWVARLRMDPAFERFGLFLNRVHELAPVWLQVREVLARLRPALELPQTSLNTDAFIGNYERTTFGAHRDRLDNLMFMVRGRRTMRLWSDEAWRAAMGECDAGDTFQDYDRAVPTSATFTLEPGDILYWPADHWHVGEGDRELSISVNLDFPVPDDDDRVPPVVQRAWDRMVELASEREEDPVRPGFGVGSAGARPEELERIERSVERLRALVASPTFEASVSREYLRWMTGAGFAQVPAPLESDALADDAWVQVDVEHPVRAMESGDRLVIAACGHALEIPATAAVADLIDRLNRGEVLRVGDLLAGHAGPSSGPDGAPVIVEPAAIRWLLEALARFRGVFVVDVAPLDGRAPDPAVRWRRVEAEELHADDPARAAVILEEHGVCVVRGALSAGHCAAVGRAVRDHRAAADPGDFGDIHERRRRFDLPIPWDPTARGAIAELSGRLGPMLEGYVGRDAELVELSTLTSLPGAKAQTDHPDSRFGDADTARLLTTFVALEAVTADMGPTSVWPGTHRSRFFECDELKREALSDEREVKLCVEQGAAVLMDSRTWHRGGANRSDRARPVLYLSLLGAGARPVGPTWSLRPELEGRLRLGDLALAAPRG